MIIGIATETVTIVAASSSCQSLGATGGQERGERQEDGGEFEHGVGEHRQHQRALRDSERVGEVADL